MAEVGARKRRSEIAENMENAVKKLKTEAGENEQRALGRQGDLVRQAGVEWLRQAFGKKGSKEPFNALKERLAKACKCSKSMAAGLHKENCAFHPLRLKSSLQVVAQDREALAKQLAKTSMSHGQVDSALVHLFGPKPPSGKASASGSASASAPSGK